ncbi:MAG: excinuclease ABC subunit UvrA [Myxococcales bacterium]|nr:excinuclease ABC subunit UvrA [Myxococcales bacterium]MDH3483401.1 excinuclease ABC subunit UvrA [Myxococcales bacterium]
MSADIVIRGAREHNLKNVNVNLPRGRLTVVTGPSGSGKSSLVFDTLYAEGQRRYVESLSGHARRILTKLPRPNVDVIEGLCPAIAVRERAPSRSPRSTVGTLTEIADYLRVLFATLGEVHCPECGERLMAHSSTQVAQETLRLPEGTPFSVLAPVVRAGEGAPELVLNNLRAKGFVRLRVDDAAVDLEDLSKLPEGAAVDVVIDRLSVRDAIDSRLAEAVELAYQMSDGFAVVREHGGHRRRYSERYACFEGHASIPKVTPRLFSFNTPLGACPSCDGLGRTRVFKEELAIPDPRRSMRGGAVAAWGKAGLAYHRSMLEKVARAGVDLDAPLEELPKKQRRIALEGGAGFEGVLPGLERRAREYARRKLAEGGDEERVLEFLDDELGQFARMETCTACQGSRLNPNARSVRVGELTIDRASAFDILRLRRWVQELTWPASLEPAARPLVQSIIDRVSFLERVGLDYLSLDRGASSLSAGEAQRVHLATQLGARLSGVLYVLDEPTAGLHSADAERLLSTIRELRDNGNTLVVVEHDRQTTRAADHLVEMGPGAGERGGEVVAEGDVDAVMADDASLTGAYLSGRRQVPTPERPRATSSGTIDIRVDELHNLRGLRAEFPLRTLCCVTGVSGSGKSTLVVDALLPAVREKLGLLAEVPPGVVLEGGLSLARVSYVDATPIGRSARSNPATYLGVLSPLRDLFAGLPEARARGYRAGRFSFNTKGGRCAACKGEGVQRIEMQLLPDAEVECELCSGRRYNDETLQIRYRGLNIAEVLALSVEEARTLFEAVPAIRSRLDALLRVGLGYLELGRRSTTLSGGEAQRVKLARDLAQPARNPTLYIFDEPTRGLHFVDVEQLVSVLQQLVEDGHTVIAVEHQLDVIRNADFILDLGPGSGPSGGRIVASGPPAVIAASPDSATGRYLSSDR